MPNMKTIFCHWRRNPFQTPITKFGIIPWKNMPNFKEGYLKIELEFYADLSKVVGVIIKCYLYYDGKS